MKPPRLKSSANSGTPPNTNPRNIYLKVSEDLRVAPAECLVFEDISMGILAGKNAGMKVCAVEDDFSMGQIEKKKALADYYITDYHEVLNHTYEHLR